jgi:hypothetical protein
MSALANPTVAMIKSPESNLEIKARTSDNTAETRINPVSGMTQRLATGAISDIRPK